MRSRFTPAGWLLMATTIFSAVRAQDGIAPYRPAKDTLVYVGTYTGAKTASKGIYVFRLQAQNEEVSQNILLVPMGVAAESTDPAFLALDEKHRRVYAANETNTGAVSAFSVDAATGKLIPLNQKSWMGAGPCHLALDRDGRHVIIANYSGGTVAVLRVEADGRLGE